MNAPFRTLTLLAALGSSLPACDGGMGGVANGAAGAGGTSGTVASSAGSSAGTGMLGTSGNGGVTGSAGVGAGGRQDAGGSTSSGSGGVAANPVGGSGGRSGGANHDAGTGPGGTAPGGAAAGGAGGMSSGGAAGSGGAGGSAAEGIPYVFVGATNGTVSVFALDRTDGTLTPVDDFDTDGDLDFMTLAPDLRTLFVSRDGSVAAFDFDRETPSLDFLSEEDTNGVGTHVAVDPTGGTVFVAHYNEGALSVLPYSGADGFDAAQLFSPGDNAHQVRLDASGTRVYVPCLGSNHVAQYDFTPGTGSLVAAASPTAPAPGGPRHLDFHPTEPVAYVLAELASQIHVYDIDATGAFTQRDGETEFTATDEAGHSSSDVHVTPDGRYVYAINRQPGLLVTFAVTDDFSLERLGEMPLSGTAREFIIDSTGQFLLVGDANGRVTVRRINAETGALTETDAVTDLGQVNITLAVDLPPTP